MLRPALASLSLSLVTLWGSAARAQTVQDCSTAQFLDRSAASADRRITWDFSISSDPERCLTVRQGQTVVWDGDLDNHPLGGSGGNMPNPIGLHQNGSVTFNAPGTFGYVCLAHSSMKGAIKVLPAVATAASPAPALTPSLVALLTASLLIGGHLLSLRRSEHDRGHA
jgi:hypothetical protein